MTLNIKDILQPLLHADAKSGLPLSSEQGYTGLCICWMPHSAVWEPGLGQFFQTWNCILYAAVHDQVCLPFSYLLFKFIFILAAQAFHRGTL